MADAEEPQFSTLAERIAALNKQKNFSSVEPAARKRPPPPPPPVRPAAGRPSDDAATHQTTHQTTHPAVPPRPNRCIPPPLPRRDTQASVGSPGDAAQPRAAPPPLPSRTPSFQPSPPQLPRRTPTQSGLLTARRNSASSEISQLSNVSSLSLGHSVSSATSHGSNGGANPRKMAPAVCDPASLPPLPPTRRELEARAREAAAKEPVDRQAKAKEYAVRRAAEPREPPADAGQVLPSRPGLPPRLPSRPAKSPNPPAVARDEAGEPKPALRKLPPTAIGGFGAEQSTPQPPPVPGRPSATADDDAPPPVPLASRPSAAQIDAVSVRPVAKAKPPNNDCWVCRDWSGPDGVAAQFPRETLPRGDPVGHLARGLCEQLPSYTDKARAIFTWFHHNISYDTVAFFGNNVKRMSVEDTIFSGRAVCQGYAEAYKAIANRAGLDCVVVGGHGKGFGHAPLKKGERPPPPKPDGHAWNAVRVDRGDWKLLDACWGAGHIGGANNSYQKEFSPGQFTASNEKFGLRHFPSDPSHQFRSDGRTVSWEEYFRGPVDGEPPTFYTNGHQEGIAEDSVEPKERDIPVHGGQVVRFQFSKICEHWTPEKNGLGRPPLLLLSIHGVDGRKDDMVPFETNGFWHWVDVDARDLGAPGQTVEVAQMTSIDGKDARGVSAKEYLSKKGRVGMAWAYVMKWELV
ncbi:Kyphoscoliosis peptidase [Tolypocladium capitatum]|uniref:Kyphoscoliosis peptidase n=1 Tax=Tolypocladium capitatum TaxID=45235 RepID=A0A2K3Q6U0_9HYPO|nr:Kyphoscoliosis peptidase [Tolypocladium capitatum]